MLYNPVYEIERMRSMIDDLFGPARNGDERNELLELTNVYDNKKSYMLQFLAPGVGLDDAAVDYSNGILSVSIKRNADAKENGEAKFVRKERSDINFTRSYSVSDDAEPDKIDAKLMNGMLMVNIPKKEEAEPKKISVKIE